MEIRYTGDGHGGYVVSEGTKTICTTKTIANAEKVARALAVCDSVNTKLSSLNFPDKDSAFKDLHDSDWGWIDQQSYYAGAHRMYNRIQWAVTNKQTRGKRPKTAYNRPSAKRSHVPNSRQSAASHIGQNVVRYAHHF